jgi:hypothetical protein
MVVGWSSYWGRVGVVGMAVLAAARSCSVRRLPVVHALRGGGELTTAELGERI